MFFKTLIFLVMFVSVQAYAEKALHAHVHGELKIDIAVEGKMMLVMMRAPAQSLLGFEFKPKTPAQKKLAADIEKTWNNHLFALVAMDKSLGCKVASSKYNQSFTEGHSEIEAEAEIHCQKDLSGQEVTLKFGEKFKKVKETHVGLIRADGSALRKKQSAKSIMIKL